MIHVDRDSTAPKRIGDDSGRIDSRFPDHRSRGTRAVAVMGPTPGADASLWLISLDLC